MAKGLPKAIIFDLDDTILDSGDPDVAWRRICAEFAGNVVGTTPSRFFDALIEARDGFWELMNCCRCNESASSQKALNSSPWIPTTVA